MAGKPHGFGIFKNDLLVIEGNFNQGYVSG